jgi:hypothetical protein
MVESLRSVHLKSIAYLTSTFDIRCFQSAGGGFDILRFALNVNVKNLG